MSILFFHFDGTTNEPADAYAPTFKDESISNVLKSHLLLGGGLEDTDGRLQVPSPHRSFYYSGIGTYGSLLERWLNASFAFESADVAQILRRALYDFQCHFHANIERIILIGFSRGAALARRFAALINPYLKRPIVIEAVMDTVASIGWPNLDRLQRPTNDVVFEEGGYLPCCVTKALHLLALDEQRLAFRPTLMNDDQRVEEVWLPGVHSDVGGGYRKDGLADLSFSVMSQWLHRALEIKQRRLYFNIEELPLFNQPNLSHAHWSKLLELAPTVGGEIHTQQRPLAFASATLAPRYCHVWRNNQPCSNSAPLWHRSVFQRMQLHSNYQPCAQVVRPALGWVF
ncbi:phospholipase effector Tle1 domain-containing protein [Marinomonas atlantica]|uniref:phospholipase effector Tle1 domain-containing protein n=1 Tax=Marinomonas atlantica TaxID=1806668 RepID=UPI000834B04D|nr:DUF2235 domain-containing protein [Marinomonas atlantica]